MKKVKIRNLTEEQIKRWVKNNWNKYDNCNICSFSIIDYHVLSNHKYFLNREIEIEVEE